MRSTHFVAVFFMACASLALAGESSVSGSDAEAATDLWRRTAHGWERIGDLRAELARFRTPDDFFVTDELSRPPAARWDFHPAMLLVVQVLGVAAAFGCCEASRRCEKEHARQQNNGGCDSLAASRAMAKAA